MKKCVLKTDTGRSARAVMATEVSRVCDLRQLLLVLEVQSTSNWQNALRPQMQRDMSRKIDKTVDLVRSAKMRRARRQLFCLKMKVKVCLRSAKGNDVRGDKSANGTHIYA